MAKPKVKAPRKVSALLSGGPWADKRITISDPASGSLIFSCKNSDGESFKGRYIHVTQKLLRWEDHLALKTS